MARLVKALSNMEIDEISLVDRGANQHAAVSIAKRAPEEDHMPEFYLEDGTPLTDEAAQAGMTVYDDEGVEYTLEANDAVAEEVVEERELAEVGKSAFFKTQPQSQSPIAKSFAKSVMEQVSKAYTDEERDAVFSKALEDLATENERNAEIAKAERDLRLDREYIAKAQEWNVPGVTADELGPVMKRMAETLAFEDCEVIAKALQASGTVADALFDEIGHQGGGANSDVMRMVDGLADEAIAKAAETDISKAAATVGIFDHNPGAYDEFLADQRAAQF